MSPAAKRELPQWVTDWIKQQKNQGQKCLEIKTQHNTHYLYKSTTYWDKQTKKRRKHSPTSENSTPKKAS
ncbi:MAG: hypothetical protein LBI79_04885 [Nitrososphaerota archaeon]|nr:hypothetical protein [Nitrososphaerota archaeon]